MPSVDRKWTPLVLIGLAAVASLLAYGWLPPVLELRMNGLVPFDTNEASDLVPRWLALSLLPALALVMWAAFRAAPTARGERIGRRVFRDVPHAVTSPEQFARFGKTYDTIVLAVVMLLLAVHAAIIAGALGYGDLAVRIIPMVLGLCLILMGNVMPRLRPNWVAGVRTKRTLEDPGLWRSTHRAFGTAFVLAGVLTMIVGGLAPRYGLVTGIGSLMASCIVGFIASTRPRHMASL
ncbi:MAG TPA: SdpI family protein [Gemmatimonadaceae bacterium]|nr:SdpI family protein [Gemmatimonadaceae bacterium]